MRDGLALDGERVGEPDENRFVAGLGHTGWASLCCSYSILTSISTSILTTN